MIRFIDLTDQINEGFEFAFYDTVPDRFCEFGGNQTWQSVADFVWDFKKVCDEKYLERFLKLIVR